MGKITINDIALKAGVTKATVSFALNKSKKLPESTIRRITEIAEKMGYTPDPLARSMSTKKTETIGLLVPQSIPEIVQNPFFNLLLEGIGEVCRNTGKSLLITPPLKGSIERAVSGAVVDGFLTTGLESFRKTVEILKQRHIPFVMIDSDPENNIPCVNSDDFSGAYQAMKHVLDLGHRSIAILGIRSGLNGRYQEYKGTIKNKINGYLEALKEADLSINKRHVHLIECVATIEGGKAGFLKAWSFKNRPTAVVAMGDIIAAGAFEAARENNLGVPEEISIVGYDGITLGSLMRPRLTTVVQPIRQKGVLAAELLEKLIAGEIINYNNLLPVTLSVGGSSAKALF